MATVRSPTHIQNIAPGYYLRWSLSRTRTSRRIDLEDFLEAASSLSNERLALLMAYFKEAVECKGRYRLTDSERREHEHQESVRRLAIFSLFPNLPFELRTMIWKLSLPDSRILEVFRLTLGCLTRSSDAKKAHREVLHIARSCGEANAVVTKRYTKLRLHWLQGEVVKSGCKGTRYQRQSYFADFENDLFYFAERTLHFVVPLDKDDRGQISKVQNIAFPIYDCTYDVRVSKSDIIPKGFEAFSDLRNVIFVGDCERIYLRRKKSRKHTRISN